MSLLDNESLYPQVQKAYSLKNTLAQAIIWEAFHRRLVEDEKSWELISKIYGGEDLKQKRFNPRRIEEKYGCSYDSARKQFKDLSRYWLEREKYGEGDQGYFDYYLKDDIYGGFKYAYKTWISKKFIEINFRVVEAYLFEFLSSLVSILREPKGKRLEEIEKEIEENKSWSGKGLKKMVDFGLRFFSPLLDVEFIGRGRGKRTFYYSLKEGSNIIFASDKWKTKDGLYLFINPEFGENKSITFPPENPEIKILSPSTFTEDFSDTGKIPSNSKIFILKEGEDIYSPEECENCREEKIDSDPSRDSHKFYWTQHNQCRFLINKITQYSPLLGDPNFFLFKECPKSTGSSFPYDETLFIPGSFPSTPGKLPTYPTEDEV